MANVGFIGLGHMGLPMALRLLAADHDVVGYDLDKQAKDQFAASGGIIAENLWDVAKHNDVVITMLQTGDQVLEVCKGERGLFSRLLHGSLFIDCSTIDVVASREVHALAHRYQILSLDAPVSGGVAGAKAGTLTFMVGGDASALEKGYPVLSVMGQKIIHTGGAGNGQIAKICNNMTLGISMIAISEAFTLAKALGLSPEKLFEVLNNSSGQCWALSKYAPVPDILENVPANFGYKPGFASKMMLKDLILSQDAKHNAKVHTPLGQKAMELYQQFINEGHGELDFSAIIQLIQNT